MILFPAIDLKDGQCVRLKLGDMDQATVYNPDPGRAGARPSRTRASNGCMSSISTAPLPARRVNGAAVEAILQGDARTRCSSAAASARSTHIESWLARGLARVILGTVAVRDPALVHRGLHDGFPARSPSASTPRAARSRSRAGPRPPSSASSSWRKQFEGAGVAAIIYTDIDRDGILAGINWDSTLELADAVSIPVIASGGLASLADIRRMTSRMRQSSKAPSPAGRSMTGASIRRKRWRAAWPADAQRRQRA